MVVMIAKPITGEEPGMGGSLDQFWVKINQKEEPGWKLFHKLPNCLHKVQSALHTHRFHIQEFNPLQIKNIWKKIPGSSKK